MKRHAKTIKHQKIEKSKASRFIFSPDKQIIPPKGLSDDENVTKAEMIQSLHVVDTNQSFSSYSFDSESFKRMIPDSIIAKGTNNQKQK